MTTARAAFTLGFLGLIPFVALAAAAVLAPTDLAETARFALLAYGATILSFLGGLHWGFVLAPGRAEGSHVSWLVLGVCPQLLGWLALLVSDRTGFLILAAALAGLLWLDRAASAEGLAPAWLPKLRWPLSLGAAASLVVAATLGPA
jgi:hypothetical protein